MKLGKIHARDIGSSRCYQDETSRLPQGRVARALEDAVAVQRTWEVQALKSEAASGDTLVIARTLHRTSDVHPIAHR